MVVITTKDRDSFESRVRWLIEARAVRVSPDYTRAQSRLMEAYIFPAIGGFDLASITPEQILPLLQKIEFRHGSQQAHQIGALIAKTFTAGIVDGVCERNPAIAARDSLLPFVRKIMPTPLTVDRFTLLVKRVGEYSASPITGPALRLSLHCLVIPGELCRAEWRDIDWDKEMWRYELPVGVSRRSGIAVHYVPLAKQAVDILRTLHLITGAGRYLFPASRSRNSSIETRVLMRALTRMGLGDSFANSRAFRARARMLLQDSFHISPAIVNQQLGHGIKDRKECDPNCGSCLLGRRKMMQIWSDYIERIMASE